ncbi:hypothetical protein BH09BAC5_BH09BAC5_00920 [soil metagenome]
MKKHLLVAIFLLSGFCLFAQPCVMDTSVHATGIYPDTLPTGTVGVPYSTDITFFMPTDTGSYQFTNFHIVTVTLPVGLNWQCSNFANGCNYNPQISQYGCANISGTPLLAGFYPIDVTVLADLNVATGIPVTFTVYMRVNPAISNTSNNGFSMTGFNGCSPITVNFTNNNPGLLSYFWDFGNSNQTTAENPVPQVYNQPGNYVVHYEAYSDTTTSNFYTLTGINIQSIQNSASWGYPIDGNPDLYVIVKDNGTPVYQSNYYADTWPPNAWLSLNVNLNPAHVYTMEVWDADSFEFGFGSDDYIGTHTMSLNGCVGCAAGISVVDYTVNHVAVPPSPSVVTNDTIHVYGYPGIPNIYYDSLNHVLHTDSIQYSLQWYLNGSPQLGQNAGTDTVFISGDYFVIAVNANGCTAFADTITAIYCDTTWHPHVLVGNASLMTIDTTGNTMQWYLNGNPIPGETGDIVSTATNGVYTVAVTNSFGCTFFSWPQTIEVGINELNSCIPSLFPNPADESVNVHWNNSGGNSTIIIQDITGRVIKEIISKNNSEIINTADLPEGIYFVVVRSGERSGVARLAVSR